MVRQTSGKSWAAGQICNRASFVMFPRPHTTSQGPGGYRGEKR